MYKRKVIFDSCLAVRLTKEQRENIDVLAEQMKITPGEYARQILLDALNEVDHGYRIMLAELWSQKFILGRMLAAGLKLDNAFVQDLIDEADKRKFAAANKQILQMKERVN
jgi:predicted DNA-binding protein